LYSAPGRESLPGVFAFIAGKKKANRQVGSEFVTRLFGIVCVLVFAAIAFSTMTIQVQAVVGQTDAMSGGNFTLTCFDGVIAEFNHLATVEANQVIVMMLLRQFKNGFTAFEIMAGDNSGVIELVQNEGYGRKSNPFAHVDQ